MRRLFLIFLLLLSFFALSEERRKSIHWEKIIGWKNTIINAYVDKQSIRHDDKNDYGSGFILFVSPEQLELDNGTGGKILAYSVARHFIVDCSKGFISTTKEFYFNIKTLPTLADIPVGGTDFTIGELKVRSVPKSSTIYQTLCPIYL